MINNNGSVQFAYLKYLNKIFKLNANNPFPKHPFFKKKSIHF